MFSINFDACVLPRCRHCTRRLGERRLSRLAAQQEAVALSAAAGFLVFPASEAALAQVKSPALAGSDFSLACCNSCFLAYFQPRRVLPDQSLGVPYVVSG